MKSVRNSVQPSKAPTTLSKSELIDQAISRVDNAINRLESLLSRVRGEPLTQDIKATGNPLPLSQLLEQMTIHLDSFEARIDNVTQHLQDTLF